MSGEEIKNIRTRLGMTQLEFGRKIKADPRTVSRWETEETHPTPSTEKRLRRLQGDGSRA